MERNDTIKKRLDFYFDKSMKVHISCGPLFYNGSIIEINFQEELIILRDDILGEIPVYFEEIKRVEPYVKEDGGW